jgi:subtilisin family serine protease
MFSLATPYRDSHPTRPGRSPWVGPFWKSLGAAIAMLVSATTGTAAAAPRIPPAELLLIEGSEAGVDALLANLKDAEVAAILEPRLENLGITPLRLIGTEAAPPDYKAVEAVIDDAIANSLIGGVVVPVDMGIGGGQTGSIWVSGVGLGDPIEFTPTTFGSQYGAQSLALSSAHGFATGRGVTVAVLDTGVFASGPLRPFLVERGYDCFQSSPVLAAPPIDAPDGLNSDPEQDTLIDECVGHGNFVGSIIALVAPEARQYHVRCIDSDGRTDSYLIAQAIEAAIDAKVQVINLSLMVEVELEHIQTWVDQALSRGITVVASAGNRGQYRAVYPAAYPGVISVGGSNAIGNFAADLSNHHESVTVCGPAETPPVQIGTSPADDKAVIGVALPAAPFYRASSGTSFASAWVSGVAALARSAHPDWPNAKVALADIPAELKSAIAATATRFLNDAPYPNKCGSGVVEARSMVTDADPLIVPRAAFDIVPDGAGSSYSIDAADLAALLGAWGPVPAGRISYADLDHDGSVGAGDLAILLSQWAP